MQTCNIGGIGDFGKLALLRHVMKNRRLTVCWYPTSGNRDTSDGKSHLDYLNRPDDFRHLAPEVFDRLGEIFGGIGAVADPLTALQMSGILPDAIFLRNEVPTRASLRRAWADGLCNSVTSANLVFLDPDNGVQGKRLTKRHVALAEIAALRRQDRALIVCDRQSGRTAEAKFLASGCDRLGVIPLRLFACASSHPASMSFWTILPL
jgi:hypothetical protein